MYGSSEIEVPFYIIYNSVINLDFSRNHKTVKKFIFFEETSTNVNVETFSNVLNQQFDSFLKILFLFCDLESSLEKFHEIIQWILIHRVYNTEITNNEINDTTSFGNRSVLLSCLIDFLTCNFCHLYTFIDSLWCDFCCIKCIYKLFILEDSALSFTDLSQNFIFQLLQLFFVCRNL